MFGQIISALGVQNNLRDNLIMFAYVPLYMFVCVIVRIIEQSGMFGFLSCTMQSTYVSVSANI